MRATLPLALLCLVVVCQVCQACQGRVDAPAGATAKEGLPPLPEGTPVAPSAAASATTMTGTVLERIDAPPYSYLHLRLAAGGDDWAAVNQAAIDVGDKVTVTNVSRMDGFESKTLKRKFDKLVFGNLADGAPAAAAPAPAPVAGNPDVGSSHTTVSAVPDVKVEKATGPGAASVAELYAKRTALKDQEVTVRGKVVKYTSGIMGKNWLHIQDGSGSQASGDHDVTVTTTDESSVGAVVTVRGPLHLDRDLGAGYVYAVLVEDAKLAQ